MQCGCLSRPPRRRRDALAEAASDFLSKSVPDTIPNSDIRLYHEYGRPTDELPHKW